MREAVAGDYPPPLNPTGPDDFDCWVSFGAAFAALSSAAVLPFGALYGLQEHYVCPSHFELQTCHLILSQRMQLVVKTAQMHTLLANLIE